MSLTILNCFFLFLQDEGKAGGYLKARLQVEGSLILQYVGLKLSEF